MLQSAGRVCWAVMAVLHEPSLPQGHLTLCNNSSVPTVSSAYALIHGPLCAMSAHCLHHIRTWAAFHGGRQLDTAWHPLSQQTGEYSYLVPSSSFMMALTRVETNFLGPQSIYTSGGGDVSDPHASKDRLCRTISDDVSAAPAGTYNEKSAHRPWREAFLWAKNHISFPIKCKPILNMSSLTEQCQDMLSVRGYF